MKLTSIIFNRALAPQDGWVHIVPKGTLPNQAAGVVQVLDDSSLDSILANIQKDKNRMGANWPGIYAGREHFIYDPGQDSAALGWFKDFQKRDDGIWANADGLTPAGEEAVENGDYKFTSFVSDPSDLQKMPGTQDGLPLYRVMKIETVGFTNHANGKEMLTPITNRASAKLVKDAGGNDVHEFDLNDLDAWCHAVKTVMDRASLTGHQLLTIQEAWTYAKQQFPDLYAAAFSTGANDDDAADDDSADDAAEAAKQASLIANRAAKLAGKSFDYGWKFAAAELPRLFNRMKAPHGRVMNRMDHGRAKFAPANTAKVFNRLVRAEMILKSQSEQSAHANVCKAHPGLTGLVFRGWLGSDALGTEPGLSDLLA